MEQNDRVREAAGAVFRWTFGSVEFNEAAWELRVGGGAVDIERRPLDVLACLLRHAGEVVTKDELLDAAWSGRVVVEGALTNAIGKLRKAIGDDDQSLIATVPRVGYRFLGRVERRLIERRAAGTQLATGDVVPRRPNWRLVHPLDHSGAGEVWLAEHAKTRERRVFKFSFDGSRLGSLKREATIARLLHDSLGARAEFVRVIDWDFEDAPYFIESEFGGANLEQWAESKGRLSSMPLAQRVELLAKIADAVAAAHELGVLHKDLKPANVLIHETADGVAPRLVDFGSGRVLDPERLEALGITRLGLTQTQTTASELTGTPLYLAPELLAGQVPTVRSDIYALGVMLYQLCVGDLRRPLSAGWENDIGDPLLRDDIGSAANGNPDLRFDSARAFVGNLRSLGSRARVAAMAQERAQREQRAQARSRRRRRWLTVAFAAMACGLAVAIGMYRQVADANARAKHEAHMATAINRFLNEDVLAAANPVRGGRTGIGMKEALDAAAPQIDARFLGMPEISASLHRTLGNAYYQTSDFPAAIEQFAAAATQFARAEGKSSADAVGARVAQAQALAHADRSDEAGAMLDEAAPLVQKLTAEHPMLRVNEDLARAWIAFNTLRFDAAIAPLEDAAQRLVGLPDADPFVVATVGQALVSARSRMGLPPESLEQTQQRLLAKIEGEQGRSAPMSLGARHLLARIQVLRGKGREMEQTYLDLTRDFNRVLGPENENTLLVMHGLANIYTKLERWDDSARNARIAYEGLSRRVGPDHIGTLNALDTLALAEFRLGHIDESSRLFEAGIDRLRASKGKMSGLLLSAFEINLAYVRLAQDRLDDAVALVADVREHGGVLLEKDSDAAGELACLEGRIAMKSGNDALGAAKLREGIALLEKQNPADYWIIREAKAAMQPQAPANAP
jgi:non-specific serine/threonine protein kinase